MEKFLAIQDVLVMGEQLVSVNGIKTITTAGATATTVVISYIDGTATTITTAAQVDADVYLAVKAAVKGALATGWTKPAFSVTLPKAITSIVNA